MRKYTPRKLKEAWYCFDMAESCSNLIAFAIVVLTYPFVKIFSLVNNFIYNHK